MIHKGIEYHLTATSEPDIWQWRFAIGDQVKTGKTQTRLAALAERRVQLKIDSVLKALSNAATARSTLIKYRAIEARAEDF
jgi:hypothetical protein